MEYGKQRVTIVNKGEVRVYKMQDQNKQTVNYHCKETIGKWCIYNKRWGKQH